MKALTVKQPWAQLIVYGYKDVENRTRKTNYRGPVAIHVSQTRSKFESGNVKQIPEYASQLAQSAWENNEYAGHIIGMVELVDCVRDSSSRWAFADHWHWILTVPTVFADPIPAKGKLGLWEWAP